MDNIEKEISDLDIKELMSLAQRICEIDDDSMSRPRLERAVFFESKVRDAIGFALNKNPEKVSMGEMAKIYSALKAKIEGAKEVLKTLGEICWFI